MKAHDKLRYQVISLNLDVGIEIGIKHGIGPSVTTTNHGQEEDDGHETHHHNDHEDEGTFVGQVRFFLGRRGLLSKIKNVQHLH